MKQIEIIELENKLDNALLIEFFAEIQPDTEVMLKSPFMNQNVLATPVKNMACQQSLGLVPPLSEWTSLNGAYMYDTADGKTTLFQVGERFYSVKRYRGRMMMRSDWGRVA